MIRSVRKLVRFVAWIMSPDELDSDAEDPPGRLQDSGRRWLLAREQLPEAPPSQAGRGRSGWWRFFLAPETLGDAETESAMGSRGPTSSFLREILRWESPGTPEAEQGSSARPVGFLRRLLARDHLGAPEVCPKGARRSFLRWLLSREAIDQDRGTQNIEAPVSGQG